IVMDGEMLLEMADAYRNTTSQVGSVLSSHNLQPPDIQDHRGLDKSKEIQSQVDMSMSNQDDTVSPIQNLSAEPDYTEFRTGVDVEKQDGVPETPKKYSINQSPENFKEWQRDAQERQERKPIISSDRGSVRRVSAGEII
ncbi:unnamed protein product, partial [marine sediment metagenome]